MWSDYANLCKTPQLFVNLIMFRSPPRNRWAFCFCSFHSKTECDGLVCFYLLDEPGGFSGPQDDKADHVCIVEKVENGTVYTVEGNSGDSVRINSYPIGYYEILGYGVPKY